MIKSSQEWWRGQMNQREFGVRQGNLASVFLFLGSHTFEAWTTMSWRDIGLAHGVQPSQMAQCTHFLPWKGLGLPCSFDALLFQCIISLLFLPKVLNIFNSISCHCYNTVKRVDRSFKNFFCPFYEALYRRQSSQSTFLIPFSKSLPALAPHHLS